MFRSDTFLTLTRTRTLTWIRKYPLTNVNPDLDPTPNSWTGPANHIAVCVWRHMARVDSVGVLQCETNFQVKSRQSRLSVATLAIQLIFSGPKMRRRLSRDFGQGHFDSCTGLIACTVKIFSRQSALTDIVWVQTVRVAYRQPRHQVGSCGSCPPRKLLPPQRSDRQRPASH